MLTKHNPVAGVGDRITYVDFEEQLGDESAGCAADIRPGRPLVVAFGGIKGGLDMPPFEFFGMLSELDASKVFLRDLDQVWYQKGVRGIGGIESVTRYLEDINAQQMLLVGNSAGAFGALLFGSLLHRGRVLAFSPQTFLGRAQRLQAGDFRWRKQVANLHRISGATLDLLDIGPVSGEVHYSVDHRLDKMHAERISDIPGLSVVGHHDTDHELVRVLKQSGQLKTLLLNGVMAQ